MDVHALFEYADEGGDLTDYAGVDSIPNADLLRFDVDVLIPAAIENSITVLTAVA